MKKTTYICVICVFICVICVNICVICVSQNHHLSQFTSLPLSVNPALTGIMKSEIRSIVNYSSQWTTLSSPFATTAASVDMPFEPDKLKSGWLGGGLVMLNHKAGAGYLDYYKGLLSGSYLVPLNEWLKFLAEGHYLSFGLQVGMLQYKKDFSKLPIDEQLLSETIKETKLDMKTGILWAYTPHQWFKFYSGIALSHFLKAKDPFIEYHPGNLKELDRSGIKPVFHSNAIIYLGSRIELSPSILYMYHKQANLSSQRRDEITLGTSAGFHFGKYYNWSATYYLGTWYGFKDEVVFMVGLRYHKWMFEISTDAKISLLKKASFDAEHPEFTFTYLIHLRGEKEKQRLPWLNLQE